MGWILWILWVLMLWRVRATFRMLHFLREEQ